MKKMMMVMLLFVFSVMTFSSATAQTTKVNEEYKKELYKYYELSGSDASITAAVDGIKQMMTNLPKQANAKMGNVNIDENLIADVIKKLMDAMIEEMTPIYEKNISLEDLKALNKFYSSKAGKRIGEAMPNITKESMGMAMSMAPKIQKIMMEAMSEKK